jgi:hypothetical protein
MTAIERTAYPRFTRAPSVKELREIYTPTPGDIAFVATRARGPSQKFALMILLAVLSPYQTKHIKRFGNYELDLSAVPAPITDDLTFAIEAPKEPDVVEADQEALS